MLAAELEKKEEVGLLGLSQLIRLKKEGEERERNGFERWLLLGIQNLHDSLGWAIW